MQKTTVFVSMVILIIVGLYLRLHNLGYYSLLASDDALTTLSIKNIMKYGYSAFPSGVFYPKELVFTRLSAWLSGFLGFNEFSLRVINVPLGIGVILLIYLLGKGLFNRSIGLLSAALITFATWELEFTRYIRSYILVQFFLLLSIYLFVRAFIKEERISKVVVFSFFILTVFGSFLGSILIMAILSLWLVKGRNIFNRTSINVFVFSFIAFVIVWLQFFNRFFEGVSMNIRSESVSLFSFIHKIPMSQLSIISHLFVNRPILWYSMVLVYSLVAMKLIKSKETHYPLVLSVMILTLFSFSGLAIWVFCAYTIFTKSTVASFKDKNIIACLAIIIAGIAFWLFYGIFFWKGAGFGGVVNLKIFYEVARNMNLVKLPSWLYLFYLATVFPKMSFMVVLGLCLLYLNALKNENRNNAAFVFLFFISAILFLSFPVKHSLPRYAFVLYPIFILIYSFAVIEISRYLVIKLHFSRLYKKIIGLMLVALLLFLTIEHADPLEAAYAVNVAYGEPVIHPYLATSHYITHYFDYKSASLYVRDHLKKDDIVVTAWERLVPYVYIGRVDYNIYFYEDDLKRAGFFEEKGAEPYIGNGGICGISFFKKFLDIAIKENKTVWVVAPNYSYFKDRQRELVYDRITQSKDFSDFLKAHSKSLVYVGKDSVTQVYRFAPDNYR